MEILTVKIEEQSITIQIPEKNCWLGIILKILYSKILSENTDILLQKFHSILCNMEIDPSYILTPFVDYHPTVQFLDLSSLILSQNYTGTLSWGKTALLGNTRSPVYIREHYDEATEKNLQRLLPIRRAAIDMGQCVWLIGDKLTIDGKPYTVQNLGELPPNLTPDSLAQKHKLCAFYCCFNIQ